MLEVKKPLTEKNKHPLHSGGKNKKQRLSSLDIITFHYENGPRFFSYGRYYYSLLLAGEKEKCNGEFNLKFSNIFLYINILM